MRGQAAFEWWWEAQSHRADEHAAHFDEITPRDALSSQMLTNGLVRHTSLLGIFQPRIRANWHENGQRCARFADQVYSQEIFSTSIFFWYAATPSVPVTSAPFSASHALGCISAIHPSPYGSVIARFGLPAIFSFARRSVWVIGAGTGPTNLLLSNVATLLPDVLGFHSHRVQLAAGQFAGDGTHADEYNAAVHRLGQNVLFDEIVKVFRLITAAQSRHMCSSIFSIQMSQPLFGDWLLATDD
jgi:hypothetical protein